MEAKRAEWILAHFDEEGLLPVRPSALLGYPNSRGLSRTELLILMELTEELNDRLSMEERELKYYTLESALQKIAGRPTIKFFEVFKDGEREYTTVGNELNEEL